MGVRGGQTYLSLSVPTLTVPPNYCTRCHRCLQSYYTIFPLPRVSTVAGLGVLDTDTLECTVGLTSMPILFRELSPLIEPNRSTRVICSQEYSPSIFILLVSVFYTPVFVQSPLRSGGSTHRRRSSTLSVPVPERVSEIFLTLVRLGRT